MIDSEVRAGNGSNRSEEQGGGVGWIRKVTSMSKGALIKNILHVWFCTEESVCINTCAKLRARGTSQIREKWMHEPPRTLDGLTGVKVLEQGRGVFVQSLGGWAGLSAH